MQGLKNALKGVQYSNPQLGERLYELCRKATSRHIDRPDEILNQQVQRVEGPTDTFVQPCALQQHQPSRGGAGARQGCSVAGIVGGAQISDTLPPAVLEG